MDKKLKAILEAMDVELDEKALALIELFTEDTVEDDEGEDEGSEEEDNDGEEEEEDDGEEIDWSDATAVQAHVAELEAKNRRLEATRGIQTPEDMTIEEMDAHIATYADGRVVYTGPTKTEGKTGTTRSKNRGRVGASPSTAGKRPSSKPKEPSKEELLATPTFAAPAKESK